LVVHHLLVDRQVIGDAAFECVDVDPFVVAVKAGVF
jgi:hypothetical protein